MWPLPMRAWSSARASSPGRARTRAARVFSGTAAASPTAYVRAFLAPALVPGQIVVLDNLAVHKGAAIRRLIQARGCRLLFLPPYSPDFAPIEHAFGKLKEHLRRAEARTREALDAAIATALDTITAHDAAGWFRHCGYPTPG